jgi:hypothetical protein
MLEKEAIWIAGELNRIGTESSPVLNVGSSTLYFRTQLQPFIHERIIVPFEKAGGAFLHLDMKKEEGVDLAGDLMDAAFREEVKALSIKGILCSNLLEHVEDPAAVCALLMAVVQPGGYIILTVPYRYPYHNDPIDTMFRPEVNDLEQLLPGCGLVNGEIVTIEGTSFFRMLLKHPKLLAVTFARTLLPFYKFSSWKHIVAYLPDSFKPFQVTCATFRKQP